MMFTTRRFTLFLVLAGVVSGFMPSSTKRPEFLTAQKALWRHFVPRQDHIIEDHENPKSLTDHAQIFRSFATALFVSLALSLPANAVSGGGLDFANLDITGQDFSNGNYKGKDFTQVIAKGTKFVNSNLQGCRFYKAFLVNADFSGADLRGASLEDTSMDGALLKGANAAGAYFSASLADATSLENVDFTEAQVPVKTINKLCERDDVKGTNPTTGADTRESLMCF